MENTTNTTNYDVKNLSVLSDLEHIRARPGMYIGEPDSPKHLLKEAFDNALDECQNGYSSIARVVVNTSAREYSVYDEGRGIPIGLVNYDYQGFNISMESLKLLVSVAKSGGKFNGDNYKISGGLHGLGMCCITALSEKAKFVTRRGGQSVTVLADGGTASDPAYAPTDLPNGVEVTFKGEPTIFETTEIPYDYIFDMCNVAKAFGYPVELIIDGNQIELPGESLFDLMPKDNDDVSEYVRFEIKATDESTGENIRVALKYTSDINSKPVGFANLIPTRAGGTHVKEIEKAIESVWSEFMKESDVELRPYDCRLGLRYVTAIFLEHVSFAGQTKDKLSTKASEFSGLINQFKVEFRNYLIENENVRKALLKRFAEYRAAQNNLLARKEIMSLIKINEPVDSSTRVRRRSVVANLYECKSPHKDGTQLYIVEGNSAAGGMSRARDRNTQAILPLRGKIKNVTYMSINDALKSETVRNIINSVGCGVGPEADPRRSRYEEILISADADPDGSHITALVLSVFVNLLPELVKSGMVKVVHAPLFGYNIGKTRYYTNNFDEIPENATDFSRYKGLGELDDDEVRDTLLSRENQIVSVVEYPTDVDRFNQILGTSGGRSELLKELGIIRYV